MELQNLMNNALEALFESSDLDLEKLDSLLGNMVTPGIDLAEFFFQSQRYQSWSLEEGIVKDGVFSIDQGVGVRAISEDKTGFSYAEDISSAGLISAIGAARSIARQGKKGTLRAAHTEDTSLRYSPNDPIVSMEDNEKVGLLSMADKFAREADPRVSEVSARLSASYEVVLVMASDGTLQADIRPLVRMDVSVIVVQGQRRERGSAGGGGRTELTVFRSVDYVKQLSREAVRIALLNLDAIAAPAGSMEVVLGPGWPGVLLHEAVGHGLEGDFNRKGSSAFAGRIGELVASPLCTIIDDGTIKDRRGSLTIDDEGSSTQRTVLIENGVLKGYLQDKLNARLMNVPCTGNGRRESFSHLPMPRMTNTFMLGGDRDPEEILSSVKKGIYAVNFGGGQVDITSGQFVFSTTEAYLIENGKLTVPIKGATLIGNGPEVMSLVSMVGNDLALDNGVGVCGKDGQSVPVGVGQPTLKVDNLTVGGTHSS